MASLALPRKLKLTRSKYLRWNFALSQLSNSRQLSLLSASISDNEICGTSYSKNHEQEECEQLPANRDVWQEGVQEQSPDLFIVDSLVERGAFRVGLQMASRAQCAGHTQGDLRNAYPYSVHHWRLNRVEYHSTKVCKEQDQTGLEKGTKNCFVEEVQLEMQNLQNQQRRAARTSSRLQAVQLQSAWPLWRVTDCTTALSQRRVQKLTGLKTHRKRMHAN